MADRMSRCVEQIETAISKVVICMEASDLQALAFSFDVNFPNFTSLKVAVQ